MKVGRRAVRISICVAMIVPVLASQAHAQSTETSPAAAAQSAIGASHSSVFENLSVFAGLDGSKQPQDLGINANMGLRLSANWGFRLPMPQISALRSAPPRSRLAQGSPRRVQAPPSRTR